MNLKKGYVVARKSYGKDVIFVIDKVIKRKGRTDFAILKGLTIRIKADAPVSDLEIVSREEIEKSLKDVEETIKQRARKISEEEQQYIKIAKRYREIIYTGKILHLDGDAHLSNKKKYSNTNTSEQVIFNHNKNNVSKIKIHYFFITKREENCEREHI